MMKYETPNVEITNVEEEKVCTITVSGIGNGEGEFFPGTLKNIDEIP